MLFSTVFTKSLVLSLFSTGVLSTPVPDEELVEVRAVASDVLILGAPEVLSLADKRFLFEEDELVSRQQTTPPTADHREALRLHNAARTRKGLKSLIWDKKLETDAKAWAKQIAANDKMVHSSGSQRPGQGENLAYSW